MPKNIKAEGKTYVVPDDATDEEINQIVGPGTEKRPDDATSAANRYASSAIHALGLPANKEEYRQAAAAEENKTINDRLMDLPILGPLVTPRTAVSAFKTMKRGGEEGNEAIESLRRGDLTGAAAHEIGGMGYTAAGVLTPVGGSNMVTSGEQFGRGDVAGGLGSATPVIAPMVLPGARGAARAARPVVGEGVARAGGTLMRNAEPIGNTVGYGGAAATAIEEAVHGRPISAGVTALMSPVAASRAIRLTRGAGEGLMNLGNRIGRTPRPLFGPEPAPPGTMRAPQATMEPTARMVDVPNFRVPSRPAAPTNMLERQTSAEALRGDQGEFPVVPPQAAPTPAMKPPKPAEPAAATPAPKTAAPHPPEIMDVLNKPGDLSDADQAMLDRYDFGKRAWKPGQEPTAAPAATSRVDDLLKQAMDALDEKYPGSREAWEASKQEAPKTEPDYEGQLRDSIAQADAKKAKAATVSGGSVDIPKMGATEMTPTAEGREAQAEAARKGSGRLNPSKAGFGTGIGVENSPEAEEMIRAREERDAKKKVDLNAPAGERMIPPNVTAEASRAGSPVGLEERGSAVGLMRRPLIAGEKPTVSQLADVLDGYRKQQGLRPINPSKSPEKALMRATAIGKLEIEHQLQQAESGVDWYGKDIERTEAAVQQFHPELKDPAKMSLFKAMNAGTSLGNKSIPAIENALDVFDVYKKTGKVPLVNPETGKGWPNGQYNAYQNTFRTLQSLIDAKGEKGAASWLTEQHPVSEIRQFNKNVAGKASDEEYGALALGPKAGPFFLNMSGVEGKLTTDVWFTRTWNRWMGTMKEGGEMVEAPRNENERALMSEATKILAERKGLSPMKAQAVLWNFEQRLYTRHGIPSEQPSYGTAAEEAVSKRMGSKK